MTREIRPLVPVSQEGWEDVARGLLGSGGGEGGKPKDGEGSVNVSANINKRKYIAVPQCNIVIATEESLKDLDMYQTLTELKKQKLRMPGILQFMTHWNNLREAALGRRRLCYADGTVVGDTETKRLWNYVSSIDRSSFNGEICWTWLNAYFDKDSKGKLQMKTDLEIKTDARRNQYLDGRLASMGNYQKGNGLVGLNFNPNGFPTSRYSGSTYEQGKNLYFWEPVEGRVARFGADSDRAGLNCGGDPRYHVPLLGVFACAEGTAAKS